MAKIKRLLTKQNPGQSSETLHHSGIVTGISNVIAIVENILEVL